MRKLAGGFFLALLLLTWTSWKLDGLRTPQVVCVTPGAGQLPDREGVLQSYPCVLPLAALRGEGGDHAVYLVEETSSFFSPLTARRASVTVQARTEGEAAVSGLASGGVQVVLYASRSLQGETVPVALWEEELPLGRVEVTCGQGQSVLAQAFAAVRTQPALAGLEAGWEDGRLVLTGADLFTARRLERALVRAGLAAEALTIQDYAWAEVVLAQGRGLWRLTGALALVWLFVRWTLALGRHEYRRGADALGGCYLSDYIRRHSVRLLAEVVALAAGSLACLALLRWLWRVELTLPTGFLPEGSLFDAEHYRRWWGEAFPPGAVSDFGRQLAEDLKKTHLLAAGEGAAFLALAGLAAKKLERNYEIF